MAVVYRATDTELKVERAVKLVRGQEGRASVRRRLRAEAQAMARIHHPSILAIHDVGTEDGHDFVVMTLAPGGSLSDLLERGPLPAAVAVHYIVQVLSALSVAHAAGIIHRDVKPHNILLDDQGRPLLADFGIALLAHDERRTRTGVAMGSIAFMPPEQRLDAARVGPEADVYACGATLYNLVTGENPVDLFMAPPSSPRFGPLPGPLVSVVQTACAAHATDRYPTAGAMAGALLDILDAGLLDGLATVRREQFAEPDMVFSQRSQADASRPSAPTFSPDELDVLRQATAASATLIAGPTTPRAPVRAFWSRQRVGAALAGLAVLSLLGTLGGGWVAWTWWPEPAPTVAAADAVADGGAANETEGGSERADATRSGWEDPEAPSPEPSEDPPALEAAGGIDAEQPPAPPPTPTPASPVVAPVPAPVAAPQPAPVTADGPAGRWEGSLNGVKLVIDLGADLKGQTTTKLISVDAVQREVSMAVRGSYDATSRRLELEEVGDGGDATFLLTLDEDFMRARGEIRRGGAVQPLSLRRKR